MVNRSFTQTVTLRLTLQDWVKDVSYTQRPTGAEFLALANRQATLIWNDFCQTVFLWFCLPSFLRGLGAGGFDDASV